MHTISVEAESLFDAAKQAIQQWSRFWWFDPDTLLTVESGEHRWTVNQERVRSWRTVSKRNPA